LAGGCTGTISAVITRINGFTGPVTIAATGVPANVIVSGGTIDAAGNTQAVTIAPALNATPGTTNVNITATATGVTIAPQPLALTVTAPASPITQLGSDITSPDAQFGSEIALSANGTRVVVSASGTANGTTRVYERTASTWNQLGADIIGEAAGDQAGTGVDSNAAGTRIAIGAYLNDGAGTATGHVRVFDLVGTTWTQVGADVDGIVSPGGLGFSVALSGSGNRLIAGAPVVGGINGTARVFDLVGGAWVQAGATLSGSSEFGDAVAISSDGNTIAVAAPFVPSSGGPGSVQVYRLTAGNWAVVGNVLSGTQNGSNFGDAVSLSADGSRIAVAATADSEGGVSGGGSRAGKVQVFDLVGSTWTQVGASVLGNVGLNGENLGQALTLSDDGTRFAASGASQSVAKVYRLTGGAWVQVGANITNTQAARSEGTALSADGGTVAVGFVNGTPKRVSVFGITP
jgi:WD40 repeat protein